MKTIIFATTNKDKLVEIREILGESAGEIKTMTEIGFTGEIEEDGTTFRENAAIKANAVADFIKENRPEYKDAIVLADDSGLEIDYYDKKPGVMSHRWLGNRTYPQAMADIIEEMKEVPEEKRAARFVCSIAAAVPGVETFTVQETVEGSIGHEIIGENGFGYDPFFYVKEYGCTTAQMSPEQKNQISHRGKAMRAMKKELTERYGL
ncbi:MAG: RdgB/HAM1 family non-canonical purine NTP pyrophosphatase [Lachnospiraceae bacterium]|nr:RdgB/HAM1 family non-canonical purine NTP pyrophosphatase [Lachnospiraceae bacterium]